MRTGRVSHLHHLLTYEDAFRSRKNSPLKPWVYKLAGILVSVFFVYLAVRRVDLTESLRALGTVNLGLLALAAVVFPFWLSGSGAALAAHPVGSERR